MILLIFNLNMSTDDLTNSYYQETNTPNEQIQLNDIYYNCSECSSNIEILSINEKEGIIEFNCINNNNHHRKMSIKDYLEKMKNFNSTDINNDKCKIHKEIYICYCFDCKIHLCKKCLQLRNHISHYKSYIIEIKPNQKELMILENNIKNYGYKLDYLEKGKFRNDINDKLREYKNRINQKKELKEKQNKIIMEKELKSIKDEYLSDMKDIKIRLYEVIKKRKHQYKNNLDKIIQKHKVIDEYNNALFKNKIKNLEKKFQQIMQKSGINQKIENLRNIKRLNEILYNTYYSYSNNYYNSININSILENLYNNNIQKNNNINEEIENIIKIKNEKDKIKIKNNIINHNQLNQMEKMKIFYENKLNDINNKFILLKSEYDKINKNRIKQTKDYSDGKYEGEFNNDKREGKGIMYYYNGDKYEGEYKNDKREGKGIMFYKSGDRYEGEFKNDKKEGKGIGYFKSGNKYEGEYKNDLKEGRGTFFYFNGDRYEGEYKNDKKEGYGMYCYNNGDREMGNYINGKGVGMHAILTINGEIKNKFYGNSYVFS